MTLGSNMHSDVNGTLENSGEYHLGLDYLNKKPNDQRLKSDKSSKVNTLHKNGQISYENQNLTPAPVQCLPTKICSFQVICHINSLQTVSLFR